MRKGWSCRENLPEMVAHKLSHMKLLLTIFPALKSLWKQQGFQFLHVRNTFEALNSKSKNEWTNWPNNMENLTINYMVIIIGSMCHHDARIMIFPWMAPMSSKNKHAMKTQNWSPTHISKQEPFWVPSCVPANSFTSESKIIYLPEKSAQLQFQEIVPYSTTS